MFFYISSSIGFLTAIMLQMGIFSRAALLSGTADIVLLFLAAWSLHQRQNYSWVLVVIFGLILSTISAAPALSLLIVYLSVFLAATRLQMGFWQSPLLSMFLLVFFGTFLEHGVFVLGMFVQGISVNLMEIFTQILLPSVLLNMLLAIPMHALVQELFRNVSPLETEI
jgi:cell shape-determining protein MreD